MDGVLADFGRGVKEMCSMEPYPQGSGQKEHDDLMFGRIRDTDRFYYRLLPMEGVIELFNDLRNAYGDRVEILTAVPKPSRGVVTAGEDKVAWVRKYIGDDVRVNIVLRAEKRNYAKGKGCILIDDMDMNISEWEDAGGTGIQFTDAVSARERLRHLGISV